MANYVARDVASDFNTTLTLTFPSSVANGHRAVLVLSSQNTGASGFFSNPNTASFGVTGWTQVLRVSSGTGSYTIFERTCDGSEASVAQQVNTTANTYINGHLLLYNGLVGAGVASSSLGGSGALQTAYNSRSSSTTADTPAITHTGNNNVLMLAVATPGVLGSVPTSFTSSDFTARGYINNSSQYGQAVFDKISTSVSGAIGATITASSAVDNGSFILYWHHDGVLPDLLVNISDNPPPGLTAYLVGGPDTPDVSFVISGNYTLTGIPLTASFGSGFSVSYPGNVTFASIGLVMGTPSVAVRLPNQTFNAVGFAGTMAVGTPQHEVQYNGVAFASGISTFTVRILAPGADAMRGSVPKILNAGTPPDYCAFQADSFQNDSFQVIAHVYLLGVLGTTALGGVIYMASYAPFIFGPQALGFGSVGSVTYKVGYSVTGVSATASAGTIVRWDCAYPITGVLGTTALGVVHPPMNVLIDVRGPPYNALPGYLATGKVGSVAVHRTCSYTLTGIYATGALGAPLAKSGYAVTGLSATGSVGTVVYEASYPVQGAVALSALGQVTGGWLQAATPLGVAGTTHVGTPIARARGLAETGLSVTGSGGLGQVGFLISGSAAVDGVVGNGRLGAVGIRVDAPVDVTGLAAAMALGNATAINMPALAAVGTSALGTVGIAVDCAVHISGVAAVGNTGLAGERRDTSPPVAGVQATGSIGSVAPALRSAFDKSSAIFVRTQ